MLNKKGFTLIESLLVISIIVVISSISMSFHSPKLDNEDIIEDVVYFFYKAKMNSMIHKEKTKVSINNNYLECQSDNYYMAKRLNGVVLCRKSSFFYNVNGNIYKASTIHFVINGIEYDFVFQIGSGCFEIR